jgi:ATP-binding cassette, subfamily B, bacterial
MSSAAFRRAKTLLNARATAVVAARALAVIHSLLLLSLLVVAGLLVSLIITRGKAPVAGAHLDQVPSWLKGQVPLRDRHDMIFVDSGLYPLAAGNQFEPSPWLHRAAARLLLGVMGNVRPLRSNLSALATLLAVALGLILLLALTNELRRRLIAEAVTRAAAALRVQIHRQMYRRGQSSLPTEGTGPVVNLFTREVNEVRDGLAAELDRTWRLPPLAAGLLLIALVLSWKLTVFLLSLCGLVWMISGPLERRARQDADRAVRDSAVQLALLHEDLGMLRTVRVYGIEGFDKARFDEHLEAYREADERRLRTEGSQSPTTWLLVGAAATLAVGLLGFAVLKEPDEPVSPAAAVVLAAALFGILRPISLWLDLRKVVRRAGRSAQGIFEFIGERPELHQAVGAQFLAPLKDRISFENVTLEGPSGRTLLSGVSAEIPARTRTAILSLDEDAKHALVCLIPRLIDPKIGRVRMDGNDLRDVTLESLRAQVASVLQSDLIFSDSVLANIGLGDPSFGLPRIIEAAKVAHAHNFIQDLPHGYDTVIGPLGEYLSVDQQYRIALARAFLHDPSIVIIEEPDVALDDDVKHLIDDTIDRLAPGRTLIFLPHRLSTIRKCDQVIVLHNGRVEAMGPPREIHGQSKLYRHIQYVEFNQFATGEVEAGQMNA